MINEIDPEENAVKIMGLYETMELLSQLIDQLEKELEFSHTGGQKISDMIMVSKGIKMLSYKFTFNKEIQERRQKSTDLNTWAGFNNFSYRYH